MPKTSKHINRARRRAILASTGSTFSALGQCGQDQLPCGACDECAEQGVLELNSAEELIMRLEEAEDYWGPDERLVKAAVSLAQKGSVNHDIYQMCNGTVWDEARRFEDGSVIGVSYHGIGCIYLP